MFCGTTDKDDTVTKVDDSQCDPAKRYDNTTECHVPADQCKGLWFAGPWSEVIDLIFFIDFGLFNIERFPALNQTRKEFNYIQVDAS